MDLYDLLGPSARHCFEPLYLGRTVAELTQLVPIPDCDMSTLRQVGGILDLDESRQSQGFHVFFFARPTAHGLLAPTPLAKHYVPTDYLRRRLWHQNLAITYTGALQHLELFRPLPQLYGGLFEAFYLRFLGNGLPLHYQLTSGALLRFVLARHD